jgi:hypothetical protein
VRVQQGSSNSREGTVIIEFKAVDLATFDGKFNDHQLQILKQDSGDWKLFVDSTPVKGGIHPTSRACMEQAEKAAYNVLTRKLMKG